MTYLSDEIQYIQAAEISAALKPIKLVFHSSEFTPNNVYDRSNVGC